MASILNINLGFSYVPTSIRVRLNNSELRVEESDTEQGLIAVHVPPGVGGEIAVDYQRRILQGGGPKHTRIVATANACIYCGATSDLSDEHIIPFALEGDFVIRSGSCKKCAGKTSKFERQVLRDALLAPRTTLKLRTRRPRERPTSLPLLRHSGGVRKVIDVPVADHPTYLALPTFALPACIRGDAIPNLKVVPPGVKAILVSPVTLDVASRRIGGGGTGVQVEIDVYAFARLLAKIAHGFVAAADLGAVEAFLPEPMFADDESIAQWVGGAPDVKVGTDGLHGSMVEVVDGVIHVRIRLFAQLGGPEYLVIAGRLIDPSDQVPIAVVEPEISRPGTA